MLGHLKVPLSLLSLAGIALCAAVNASAESPATCAHPQITLHSDAGDLVIALDPAAAPQSVAALRSAKIAANLKFEHTRPHVEVRTSAVLADNLSLPLEMNGVALGLADDTIDDPGAAMDVVQSRLIGAYRRSLKGDPLSATAKDWLARWFDTYKADFLLGVSRQQINAALGVPNTPGLASQPVTRGSVVLVPDGPALATSRLSIALTDLPQRTGRWPVIGRVVSDLGVLEQLARAPRHKPNAFQPNRYLPVEPVRIGRVTRDCTKPTAHDTPIQTNED